MFPFTTRVLAGGTEQPRTGFPGGKDVVPHQNENLGYRPEIDGLRALAVLPVIFFHAGFELLEGGFVGVDVFFVISGYLITAILYREIQGGTFTLARFYERRIRRLYPALTLVTFACLPFAWLWLLPSDFRQFLHSMAAIQVFASNIYFWQEMGYFSTAAELTPLLHTWSLAVEEQFYVVFPLALILLRSVRRHLLMVLIGLALAASLMLAEHWSTRHPEAAFFLLPTRAWELLTGSMLALLMERWRPARNALSEILALAGVAMILFAIFTFHNRTPFPGFLALLPVGGTALVIAFAQRDTLVARFLSLRPLIFIGLLSYSAYLWHQPLFAFTRIRFHSSMGVPLYLLLIILTFVLAYLSWRFVETPFRKGFRVPRRVLLRTTVLASSLLFVSAVAASLYPQPILRLEKRLEPDQLSALAMVEEARSQEQQEVDAGCVFHRTELDDPTLARLQACFERHGPGLVVLGDSHGKNVFNGLASTGKEPFLFGFTRSGCIPLADRDWCQFDEFKTLLETHAGLFRTLVYNQAGFYLLETPRGREVTRTHLTEAGDRTFEPNQHYIQNVVSYLETLSEGIRVVWLGPWTEPHILPREYVVSGCDDAPPFSHGVRNSFTRLDATLAASADELDRVRYISTNRKLGLGSGSKLINCQNIYFHDGDHWSAAGEARFGAILQWLLTEQIAESLPAGQDSRL
jgi:peptidoglycan/LPS O-acetylase OafA/YrhL